MLNLNNLNIDLVKPLYPNEDESYIPYSLFITDSQGNILVCNSYFSLLMGIPLEKLLTMNVADLVKKKVYDHSTTMEALESKQVVAAEAITHNNIRVFSTSTPVQDYTGEISMVITTSCLLTSDKYSDDEKKQLEEFTYNEYENLKKEVAHAEGIVAESLSMKRIIQACNQIASFDSRILLYGESGTGKEVLANYIHQRSNRKDSQFVSVNCAAIPETLFESELFGHEKGSFTGASMTKEGLLEVANGGTLFLDEISEMPLDLQAKLLRVLESGEFRRIGGTKTYKVDFRLISACNRDLMKMVDEGKFRKDLYYRINVIPINLPPLRNRKQDIIALVYKFVNELNKRFGLDYKINSEQLKFILNHSWPGNVRELKNYVERIVVTDVGNILGYSEEEVVDVQENNIFIAFNQDADLKDFLAEAEKQYIMKVLKDCEGKICDAANKLRIHRTALYRKLKTYNIAKIAGD